MLGSLRDLSIRSKLSRVTMLAALAALASASIAFAVYDVVTFRASLVRRVSTIAGVVSLNAISPLVFEDQKAATQTLAALRAEPHVESAAIYTRSERLFAEYHRPGSDGASVVPPFLDPVGFDHRFEGGHLLLGAPVVFENATVGTVVIRTDLTEIDQRALRYLGIVLLVGATSLGIAYLISARFQRLIAEPLLRLSETAEIVSRERDYSVRAEPAGADEIGRLIGTFNEMLAQIQRRDAEVRKVAAENESLYRQAKEANSLKDEFLATLSHELRTPLNAIVGWTKLLADGHMDPGTTARAIATIDRNARAQTRLIEDILEVSRIVSGKLQLNLHPLAMHAVIQAALDSVRPAATAKNIELVTDLAPVSGVVLGDADRLQQVVWNLLSNAIKFTARQGRVSVALGQIGSNVVVTVEDSGIGIAPSFLPHVFERFRQADSSTTRIHGGLGLGLAIVRHVVELHGGSVYAASDGEGRGARFTLMLPSHENAAAGAADGRSRDASRPLAAPKGLAHGMVEADPLLAGLSVLIVEDDDDSRDVLAAQVRGLGARVRTAASGAEALELIASEPPQVLLSDIGMPEMDGLELVRRVRSLAAARGLRIPSCAITAYARNDDRMASMQAGFDLFLSKPVEPDVLRDALESLAKIGRMIGRDV